jgi:hypothetical protein
MRAIGLMSCDAVKQPVLLPTLDPAADAHRTGHRHSAAAIVEIAEAAEQEALFANKRLWGHLTDVIASLNRFNLPFSRGSRFPTVQRDRLTARSRRQS